jgi:hypothetical protein
MTVRDLIKSSLRLIGAVATGETPSSVEQSDALAALNDMLDTWSTEKLMVYAIVREEFSLVAGTQSYTIGTSGTFNTSRPVVIEDATIEDQSSSPTVERPVQVLNVDEWSAISTKDLSSEIPTKIYIEDGFPLSTIYLWPKPSTTNKLVLYSRKPLTSFSTVGDTVSLPPGWSEALRFNLAVRLAMEYGKAPNELILAGATETKENIKRLNMKPSYLGMDSFLVKSGGFNIVTGE